MSTETPATSPASAAATQPNGRKVRVFTKVALVLVAVIAALLGVVAVQPTDFRVARSQSMAASPAAVFAQVNDFHKWEAWSPWLKIDPNAKGTYAGPTEGAGAIFRWAGNPEVGEGSMTITESSPYDRIRIRLDFLKPFEDTADVEFTFEPRGDETFVTWSMSGQNNFMGKFICLFMNMDDMIGSKYEEGLASIKAIVEQSPDSENAPADAAQAATGN